MIFVWVTWETIGKLFLVSAIVKRLYTIPFPMVYPKKYPRRWNTNIFTGPEVVCWYVNFPGASLLHMISFWVARETVGKVSLRSTIVEWSHTRAYGYFLCRSEAKKMSFSASRCPQKFRTWKIMKKLSDWKNYFWASGIGGWSPIST